MKLLLVYEIILMVLHVLKAFYVEASANNVARANSNENGQKNLNNKDDMYILIISWNMLANHSLSQMWTCVQYPRGHNNVRMSSVQIFNNGPVHKSIRILRSIQIINQMLSNENMLYQNVTINISTYTSGISSISHSLIYKSALYRYITVIQRSNEKKKCS
ncbi:hypothetical protein RFI_30282 [Reticulomyxa filosa]|uniref:Uncharacterized protein n=1 Tax=Reticulomyxa filosa TaxID=46433 RepID=X6LZQ2_RETFI|nr:hypothetical protein RFI_30282 [Reticulomyxa filosa]|eukprot:ETO07109.1 hypothetical protein RFI_30282 [Reticulomyxa filosa]